VYNKLVLTGLNETCVDMNRTSEDKVIFAEIDLKKYNSTRILKCMYLSELNNANGLSMVLIKQDNKGEWMS
jgi:hypothetical protein